LDNIGTGINRKIAPHEAFEIHELLTFKNICATKSSAMAIMVKDEDLKTLMQNDFNNSQDHIRELSELLKSANFPEDRTVGDQEETAGDRHDEGLAERHFPLNH
jgi:similar to spore coat protein